MKTHNLYLAVCAVLCFVSLWCPQQAQASMRSWSITMAPTAYGKLAMRTNATWPVVAGVDGIYTMTPIGYTRVHTYPQGNSSISDLVHGPEDRIAILTHSTEVNSPRPKWYGDQPNFPIIEPWGPSRSVQLLEGGVWRTIPANTADGWISTIDFDRNGRLHGAIPNYLTNPSQHVVFNGSGWVVDSAGNLPPNTIKLRMDSYGVPVAVYHGSDGPLWHLDGHLGSVYDMDISIYDIPAVIYGTGTTWYPGESEASIRCSVFDVPSASWIETILATGSSVGNGAIAYDLEGNLGIAYVAWGQVWFGLYDGTQWSMDAITGVSTSSYWPEGPQFEHTIGLTFDRDNNPVVCLGTPDVTYIAYDPIVIPEPVSVALLAMGAAFARRRTQREEVVNRPSRTPIFLL